MQWGTASVIVFASNIAAKIVLDLIGVAAGGNGSAVGRSLILTFGLTLLGEAMVIGMRADRRARRINQSPEPAATEPTRADGVTAALQAHHERHEERHRRHHQHRHGHDRS